jgi:hypothetical protein
MSAWVDRIFESDTAHRGSVVRRSRRTVERYSTPEELEREVRRRGFHMVLHRDQYVIFCDAASIQIIC